MKEFLDGDNVYVVFKWNILSQLGNKVVRALSPLFNRLLDRYLKST